MLRIDSRARGARSIARLARLFTFCCCACRSANSSGDGQPAPLVEATNAPRAGTTIRTEHYQIRASLPEDCSARGATLGSAATRRIGVELMLEPTTNLQVPANPYYARLVDAERNVYEATLGGCGAPLAPTLPARGRAARGWVVFELPRGARPVTLLYAPELEGVAKAELAIELQR